MFSVIVPFYQPTISDAQLKECLDSLRLQRLKDLEILLYHDGPLVRPMFEDYAGLNVRFQATAKRHNDWGHSLRDLGIAEAQGEYIVHLNADNVLYPKALKKIQARIKRTGHQPIYIMWLLLRGVITRRAGDHYEMARTHLMEDKVILKGDPSPGTIDCMQLVMQTELWRKYGGWYDKSINGDSLMYVRFCKDYEPVRYNLVMGEHR